MIDKSSRRWDMSRDTVAGLLICAALILPWNLYFGLGVPGSRKSVLVILASAILLSLGSIAAKHSGRRWIADQLRLILNVPYLVLVPSFVVFDVVQTVRFGGSTHPPGGVGPGAWLGIAGVLLAVQPAEPTTDGHGTGLPVTRILGCASIAGAALSTLFNLYWRIRYALPGSGAEFGRQHAAIVATALVYGAVAWATVFVGSRWMLRRDKASRTAATALGASTLLAGILVWAMPIGRSIDGFHGIAQNTSTAGVGFEGYLVWAAAAAVFAAPTLGQTRTWVPATEKVLLLIVVWCLGSVLMRITDLVVAVVLDLPHSPYDSAAMAAFDLVTVVLAVFLRLNLTNRSLPPAALWSVSAVLFGFTISRVVVGIGLAPRLVESQRAAAPANPVYGNDLAQQITSTFDVVLCGLALLVVAVAITAARAAASSPPRILLPKNAIQPTPAGSPKIYRAVDDSSSHGRHEG